MSKTKVKEEIDTYRTEEVVCPYCGHEESDSYYHFEETGDEEDREIECEECEKKFIAVIDRCGCGGNVYTSRKVSCKEKNRSHEWKHVERKMKTYDYKRVEVSGTYPVHKYNGVDYKFLNKGEAEFIMLDPEDYFEQDHFKCCRCDETKTVDLDKNGNPVPKEKYIHKEERPLPENAVLNISFNDSKLNIWLEEVQGSYTIFKPIIDMLNRHGFEMKAIPEYLDRTRPHWSGFFSKCHRKGKKNHLHLKAGVTGRHLEFEFYQNIIIEEGRENGEYGFNKRERMPYLIEKHMEVTWNRIIEFLQKKYTCKIEEKKLTPKDGERYVIQDSESRFPFGDPFHGIKSLSELDGNIYEGVADYDRKDKYGNLLLNGDFKYYRDSKGYLMCGKVYHKSGNRWYVLLANGEVDFESSFRFFDLTKDTPRKLHEQSVGDNHLKRVQSELSRFEKQQDYERCISIRNYLKSLEKNGD